MTIDTGVRKELLLGNEAIARGAMEAGISIATSYPGTPSTDILEYLAKHFDGEVEWSVNEKTALETAIGASYAGKRSICSMKHVGLNVASDALMTISYLGTKGGLLLAVADDPGAYSSQNEQDSRFYAKFAKIPCLEPCDSQEAKDMAIAALDLSERFELPVMLRSVTRVSHALSPVEIGNIRKQNHLNLEKNPQRMIAVPSNVVRCHKILNQKQDGLIKWGDDSGLNKIYKSGQKKGVITCGITYNYARESDDKFAILKIGYYPVNENIIREFVEGLDEVWVLEEGYPFLEEIARKFSSKVKGKMTGDLNAEGELGPDAMTKYLLGQAVPESISGTANPLPSRPPSLCPGCPHREFYKALNIAKPSFTAGDIGCYTLGASPPLSAMDSCLCMGAGISKAVGISKMGVKRVCAVIGDSTFLHSGVTALINAVYNKADITIFILDNSAIAMTGQQPTPATGFSAKGNKAGQVSLEDICLACGSTSVEVINPYNVQQTSEIIKAKLDSEGVHVIISRAPCVLLMQKQKKHD